MGTLKDIVFITGGIPSSFW